jgi:hypothetical protein
LGFGRCLAFCFALVFAFGCGFAFGVAPLFAIYRAYHFLRKKTLLQGTNLRLSSDSTPALHPPNTDFSRPRYGLYATLVGIGSVLSGT